MRFGILGPLVVTDDQGQELALGGRKQRAVLAVLLLHVGEEIPTDRLIDDLWGERAPATSAKTLQVYVSNLRKALGPGVLATGPSGYALTVDSAAIDAFRFRGLISESRRARQAGRAHDALARMKEALRLWRGQPLGEFADEPFASGELLRFEEERLEALEERIDLELALGRHSSLVGELEALVSDHPLRERLRGQLILALYRCARQADALQVYRDSRRALVEALGIEPGRPLRELHQAILEQDPRLDLTEPEVPPAGSAAGVFVGRERELSELMVALNDAATGQGRLVLLTGEPGIGKTQLTEEFAGRALDVGARVLSGRCWEAGGAPAYWPWVQAMRSYIQGTDAQLLRGQLGPSGGELATLVPELRELLPDLPDASSKETEGARVHLFDAAVSFLVRVSQAAPLVLLLDDLHAADEPSLLLLRYLARELGSNPVLVVGAYRNVDPTVRDPLSTTLSALSREPVTRRIELTGLQESDIAQYLTRTSSVKPDQSVVADVYAETGGNPFFVVEVTRLLLKEGGIAAAPSMPIGVPQNVRDVIVRRLGGLSDECRRVLTCASIFGREFSVNLVARLSELSDEALLEVVDEAMGERIVGAVSDAPGHLRFVHVLIRDTLYDELALAQRVQLHRRAGEAIETAYRNALDSQLTELARHFAEAASAGNVEKAVRYARLAGNRAVRLLAFEEAARLYRLALNLLAPDDWSERAELLVELAEAQARAGDLPQARETYLQAADLAESLGGPDLLARAALGYGGRFVWTGGDLHVMVPLLERAAAALGEQTSPLRVRVLARLANAISQQHPETSEALSSEALDMARQLGDPATLGYAISARLLATRAPTNLDERWKLTEELIANEDKERVFEGHGYRTIILSALGKIPELRRELAAMAELTAELGQPSQQWWTASTSAMLALFEGRFKEAEQLILQARELAERTVGYDAVSFNEVQRFALYRELGQVQDALPGLEQAVMDGRGAGFTESRPLLRCALAVALWETGDQPRALHLFEELATAEYAQLHVNNDWLLSASLLAELAVAAADRERAEALYRRLAPFDGLNVDTEEVSTGAVSRYLGLLAGMGQRFEQAERHFADALVMNERIGARPWLAHTQEDYARLLLTQGEHAKPRQAPGLLAEARAGYHELGMTTSADRVAALAEGLGTIA